MSYSLQIGDVIEVRGTRIKIQVNKDMNHSTFIHEGDIINNISVNGFVVIKKGFIDLVGRVDAEYLDDLLNTKPLQDKDHRFNRGTILRIIEVQILGYFENGSFNSGIKHLPMIGNLVYIPKKQEIVNIYSSLLTNNQFIPSLKEDKNFTIGRSIVEDIPVEFSVNSFFASHMGIFGNTGSGKSNTLAKLYRELFNTINPDQIKAKSSFHLIDFNGEYAHDGVFGLDDSNINITKLSTQKEDDSDKIKIPPEHFYNAEILSILFNAKEQTQKPFIKRLLKRMKYAQEQGWGFKNWFPNLFAKSLIHPSREVFEFVKEIIEYLSIVHDKEDYSSFNKSLNAIQWHSEQNKHFIPRVGYFDTIEEVISKYQLETGYKHLLEWCNEVDNSEIGWCDHFILNSKLQLASDMLNRYAQFDHINPMIHRIESKVKELEQVIEITEDTNDEQNPLLSVYSFRDCSSDIKEIMPSLIAKVLFINHKMHTSQDNINKTIHLIIDEAHNALSNQTPREDDGWHNYRLELFEEIIKEGRKFGVFLTIASQRPFDISPTIISQIHNYFIHRLVNNKDLEMIDSTVSTLDNVSRSAISTLSTGSCIVSGTALSMPVFIQVDQINKKEERPYSDNVNLLNLWFHK